MENQEEEPEVVELQDEQKDKQQMEVAKEKNKDGQIPLFVALSKDVSEGVLQALLNAWPESVKFQNDNGGIPLQIALASTHPSRGKVLPLLASWSVKVQQQSTTNLNLLT